MGNLLNIWITFIAKDTATSILKECPIEAEKSELDNKVVM